MADARIDNREELVRTLWGGSHLPDEPPTDAELILEAYRRWGEECPARLIGDFAFAIWDARRGRLFAARDPMAMRALYYRVEPRRVLFGTEVKQILAVPGVPARIFEPAVGAYLAGPFGHMEWTFYEGISQLAPAHALVVDASGQRTWRYWDIDPDFRIEYPTEEEYVEHFLEVFLEAVRCRLRSTKPVGIFLSGGMDSGSIASAAG
ncbi:MAG: asparagine synthase-related protein, partial [Actinomycetota bacterium]|nr:asparagine synthase-related protein [Actinomycetota bacterium]